MIAGLFRIRSETCNPINVIISTLTAVVHPIQLHFQLVQEVYIRKKILSLSDTRLSNDFHLIVERIERLRRSLSEHTKLQLSFETVFQLFMTTFLLCDAESRTNTRQGLSAYFEQNDHTLGLGITMSSKTVLSLLISLNIFSLMRAYYSEIVKGYTSNYNTIGKLIIFLSILCNCSVRIISMVLYNALVFGLFDLLHHYQGIYFINSYDQY